MRNPKPRFRSVLIHHDLSEEWRCLEPYFIRPRFSADNNSASMLLSLSALITFDRSLLMFSLIFISSAFTLKHESYFWWQTLFFLRSRESRIKKKMFSYFLQLWFNEIFFNYKKKYSSFWNVKRFLILILLKVGQCLSFLDCLCKQLLTLLSGIHFVFSILFI